MQQIKNLSSPSRPSPRILGVFVSPRYNQPIVSHSSRVFKSHGISPKEASKLSFKPSPLHKKEVISWLNKRYKQNTNITYLDYPSEMEKQLKLESIFDHITQHERDQFHLHDITKFYIEELENKYRGYYEYEDILNEVYSTVTKGNKNHRP